MGTTPRRSGLVSLSKPKDLCTPRQLHRSFAAKAAAQGDSADFCAQNPPVNPKTLYLALCLAGLLLPVLPVRSVGHSRAEPPSLRPGTLRQSHQRILRHGRHRLGSLSASPRRGDVGTAAFGCPVERCSTGFDSPASEIFVPLARRTAEGGCSHMNLPSRAHCTIPASVLRSAALFRIEFRDLSTPRHRTYLGQLNRMVEL
jgi:hypothetical protein